MNFNAIIKQKSIHIGGCPHQLSRDSPLYKTKTKIFSKKRLLNFNAIIKQKSIHVGGCPHQLSRYIPLYKTKTKIFNKKRLLNFNDIIKQKSIHIGGCPHQLSRDSPLYKAPLQPVECSLICLAPFSTFLVVNVQGGAGGRRSRPSALNNIRRD